MHMSIQNYKFGIDIDNTLTNAPPFKYSEFGLKKTKELLRTASLKKGTDILSRLDLDIILITGRGEYYYDDTIYWLHKNNIPFSELIMIPKDRYTGRLLTYDEYIAYKRDAYLSKKVHFCLEDDVKVIEELRKYDIVCSKVENDFEQAFWRLFD